MKQQLLQAQLDEIAEIINYPDFAHTALAVCILKTYEKDYVGVAKSVDAVGLGPAAARRGGSSPSAHTTYRSIQGLRHRE